MNQLNGMAACAAGRRIKSTLTAMGIGIFALLLGACPEGTGGAGAPVAQFSASKTSGSVPLEIQFTDQSTGEVASWLWSFGDGSGSALKNPTHFYAENGNYTVSLTVIGPNGIDTETKTDLIRAGSGGMTVDFASNKTSGPPPLDVSFTDLSSGGVTNWTWNFGDGGTATVKNPVHRYTSVGKYTVTLTAGGPSGSQTRTKQDYITVGSASGLVANFSAQGSTGDAPLTVTYTDLSTGNITSWAWVFGDGGTSAQRNPVHTYQQPGNYSVGLTIRAAGGATANVMKDGLIRVNDPNAAGIWSSSRELDGLPETGAAWNNVMAEAATATGTPNVANQDDDTDVRVLAKAIVFARTGNQMYRTQVIDACMAAIGTEAGGRTLALGRNLIGYVVAADLVGLPADKDVAFRAWLRRCLTETLDGRTLVNTHEDRPNNWGTHAGASRAAIAVYLNDTAELERCAKVFHGWLGNRAEYAGFQWGDLSWQADPTKPVGINPAGAKRDGHSIDGVLPDDQRRAGGFVWPPTKENYVWEALQGAIAQAVILHRAGYDVWEWEDQALLRAVRWLHQDCGFPATGDDTWQPHLVNYFYGTTFPAPKPSSPGKNMGWTDYTHSAAP